MAILANAEGAFSSPFFRPRPVPTILVRISGTAFAQPRLEFGFLAESIRTVSFEVTSKGMGAHDSGRNPFAGWNCAGSN